MYKCIDCGQEFERPYKFVNNEYYGNYEYGYCCPYCNGNYEDMTECHGCGQMFGEHELTHGFCVNCEKNIQEKLTAFFRNFNENEKEYIFESGILDDV